MTNVINVDPWYNWSSIIIKTFNNWPLQKFRIPVVANNNPKPLKCKICLNGWKVLINGERSIIYEHGSTITSSEYNPTTKYIEVPIPSNILVYLTIEPIDRPYYWWAKWIGAVYEETPTEKLRGFENDNILFSIEQLPLKSFLNNETSVWDDFMAWTFSNAVDLYRVNNVVPIETSIYNIIGNRFMKYTFAWCNHLEYMDRIFIVENNTVHINHQFMYWTFKNCENLHTLSYNFAFPYHLMGDAWLLCYTFDWCNSLTPSDTKHTYPLTLPYTNTAGLTLDYVNVWDGVNGNDFDTKIIRRW